MERQWRGGAGDQVDDGLVAGQRTAAPVLRDEAEEALLDLAPLARPRRKMTHVEAQRNVIRIRSTDRVCS